MNVWIEGPPPSDGQYWIFTQSNIITLANVFGHESGSPEFQVIGLQTWFNLLSITRHIPLTKPEPPAQPSEDPQ